MSSLKVQVFFSVMYDTGARKGELRNLQLNTLEGMSMAIMLNSMERLDTERIGFMNP